MPEITFRPDAAQPQVSILGYLFDRGETKDIPAELAAQMLRNLNFVDENGRNAYSEPLPAPAPAPTLAPVAPISDPAPAKDKSASPAPSADAKSAS